MALVPNKGESSIREESLLYRSVMKNYIELEVAETAMYTIALVQDPLTLLSNIWMDSML
jgi:hypothetical protein